MFKTFAQFINEQSPVTNPGMPGQSATDTESWKTRTFTIKLLGAEGAKDMWEPKNNSKTIHDSTIKKGAKVQVYDMKKKKNIKGTFISGTKNKDGDYIKVTIINSNGKTITLKPAEITEE